MRLNLLNLKFRYGVLIKQCTNLMINLTTNLVEIFDDAGKENDEAECTRSTYKINTESKPTRNSIFDTNETDK